MKYIVEVAETREYVMEYEVEADSKEEAAEDWYITGDLKSDWFNDTLDSEVINVMEG